MADTGTVALITGGALVLSQALNITYNLWSQKQKDSFELKKMVLIKKIDIGEKFFHSYKQKVILLKRQTKQIPDLPDTVDEFQQVNQPETIQKYIQNLSENLKKDSEAANENKNIFNLTEIYYDIESTHKVIADATIKSYDLNIKAMEIASRLTPSYDNEVYAEFRDIVLELKNHFKAVITRAERDLELIKNELKKEKF